MLADVIWATVLDQGLKWGHNVMQYIQPFQWISCHTRCSVHEGLRSFSSSTLLHVYIPTTREKCPPKIESPSKQNPNPYFPTQPVSKALQEAAFRCENFSFEHSPMPLCCTFFSALVPKAGILSSYMHTSWHGSQQLWFRKWWGWIKRWR